jgi:glycerophosphoryl diester phosphodiesterase
MMTRGVDGIITDDPALAAEVLRQRRELNLVERASLELAELFGIELKHAEQ